MTTIEEHKKTVEAFEKEIKQKISQDQLIEQQKIIGFATSEGSTNSVAILLHKKGLIPVGFNINHLWFLSEKTAQQHLPFDFPEKKEFIKKLTRQEELRIRLCYGKEKPLKDIEESIKIFFDVKRKVEELTNENE